MVTKLPGNWTTCCKETVMDAKDIRELLAEQREQKFRKRTDAQLEGYAKNAANQRHRMKTDPEFAEKKRNTVMKARANTDMEKWRQNQKQGAIAKYVNDSDYNKKRVTSIRKRLSRPIVTPFGEFNNNVEYNEAVPNSKNFCDNRRIKPHLYYYKDEGPGSPKYETVQYSPYGYLPKLDTVIGGVIRMMKLAIEAGD